MGRISERLRKERELNAEIIELYIKLNKKQRYIINQFIVGMIAAEAIFGRD